MDHVRPNHDTNQLTRELGLAADSVGDHGLTSVDLPYQLVYSRVGDVDG